MLPEGLTESIYFHLPATDRRSCKTPSHPWSASNNPRAPIPLRYPRVAYKIRRSFRASLASNWRFGHYGFRIGDFGRGGKSFSRKWKGWNGKAQYELRKNRPTAKFHNKLSMFFIVYLLFPLYSLPLPTSASPTCKSHSNVVNNVPPMPGYLRA